MSGLDAKLMAEVEKIQQEMLKKLIEDAKALCLKAAQTKETKNRTGAQLNSYFWLVLSKGIIQAAGDNEGLKYYQPYGKGHRGLEGTWWTDGNGDDWITPFLEAVGKHIRSVAPKATYSKNGYDIFVLDAAYYSEWLELGNLNSRVPFRAYKVTSQIGQECANVAKKYKKAKVKRVGLQGEPFKPTNF